MAAAVAACGGGPPSLSLLLPLALPPHNHSHHSTVSLPHLSYASNLGFKTQVLESCLRKKVGWQRFIKRGLHTLKKTEYQLCYLDPGIATGAELEKLKTLDSTRLEFQQL